MKKRISFKRLTSITLVVVTIFTMLSLFPVSASGELDSTVYANVSLYECGANLSNGSFPCALGTSVTAGTQLHFNVACGKNITLNYLCIRVDGSVYFEYISPSGRYFRWETVAWYPSAGIHTVEFVIENATHRYTATRYITVEERTSDNTNFTVLKQNADEYKNYSYSYKNEWRSAGNSACGPFALANALRYLGEDLSESDVKSLIDICRNNNNIRQSSGTSVSYMTQDSTLQTTFGFEFVGTCKLKELPTYLDGSTVAIVGVDNDDLRTGATGGHIIALVAASGSGSNISATVLDSYTPSNHKFAPNSSAPFDMDLPSDFFNNAYLIRLK